MISLAAAGQASLVHDTLVQAAEPAAAPQVGCNPTDACCDSLSQSLYKIEIEVGALHFWGSLFGCWGEGSLTA